MKVPLSILTQHLTPPPDVFICSASFEERCLVIAEKVAQNAPKKVFIVQNEDIFIGENPNKDRLISLFRSDIIETISTNDPLSTADKFKQKILPLLKDQESGYVLIDITTFTHEYLLILMGIIRESNTSKKIKLIYTGAKDYSVNTSSDKIWLSKGLSETRAILGFPGIMLPSKKLHLIVLMGFEVERAIGFIKKYEPAVLSIGLGAKQHSISESHYKNNKDFFDELVKLAMEMPLSKNNYKFDFSCVDPIDTKNSILSQIKNIPNYENYNVAVCPMNTKVSTVGAALAAIENQNIQLCYAQPIQYNIEGYSIPGDEVRIFDMQKFNL